MIILERLSVHNANVSRGLIFQANSLAPLLVVFSPYSSDIGPEKSRHAL